MLFRSNIFLPQDDKQRQYCISIVEKVINNEGQTLIGWRDVPVDSIKADVGDTARNSQPVIKQLIIGNTEGIDNDAFEGVLYIVKKRISKVIRTDESLSQALLFYVCSLSTRVIIYKGMLMGSQLLDFYPDLANKDFKTYLAMVHSRFSTNTFPSWDRAQPVYVFDGKPPSLKTAEIQRRKLGKKEATIKYEKAKASGDFESARKYAQIGRASCRERV